MIQAAKDIIKATIQAIRSIFKTKTELAMENLALRQQLAVLKRPDKRLKLTPLDLLFWVAKVEDIERMRRDKNMKLLRYGLLGRDWLEMRSFWQLLFIISVRLITETFGEIVTKQNGHLIAISPS